MVLELGSPFGLMGKAFSKKQHFNTISLSWTKFKICSFRVGWWIRTNILRKCRSIKKKDRRAHTGRISTLCDFTLSFFSLLEDIEMYLIDCDQSFILHFYCIHLSFGDISKDKLFIYKLSILSDNWLEFFMMFSMSWQFLRKKNFLWSEFPSQELFF